MDSNSNAGRFTGCIPSYGDAGFCAAVMDTNRGSWQRPDIVSRLITKPNMVVVDLGAGTGYFADLFSKQLPEGKIIALDPETSLIIILLTNRVHPSRSNEKIKRFRPKIHDLIALSVK